ncbi:MAG: polyphosphate polymerase domain-containing protein [Bacteroidota bacterium]
MRRELKYLVPEAERERLYRLVSPYVVPDPHADGPGRPSYTVRSVYFDTPRLRDLTQKMSGDERRRKVRLRGYDAPDGSGVVLEVKRKHGSAVWKNRIPLSPDAALTLLKGASPEALVASGELREDRVEETRHALFHLRRDHRQPVLTVTYDREPLLGRFDPSLRVTLDRRLRCRPFPALGPGLDGLYSEDGMARTFRDHFILEVKFDRVFPAWLRDVTARLGLRREALSKYGLGVEQWARRTPWRFGVSAVRAAARPVRT